MLLICSEPEPLFDSVTVAAAVCPIGTAPNSTALVEITSDPVAFVAAETGTVVPQPPSNSEIPDTRIAAKAAIGGGQQGLSLCVLRAP